MKIPQYSDFNKFNNIDAKIETIATVTYVTYNNNDYTELIQFFKKQDSESHNLKQKHMLKTLIAILNLTNKCNIKR